jgi:hypothetical protein
VISCELRRRRFFSSSASTPTNFPFLGQNFQDGAQRPLTIDHSGEHREAATLPDPYGGYIPPPRKKETPEEMALKRVQNVQTLWPAGWRSSGKWLKLNDPLEQSAVLDQVIYSHWVGSFTVSD